MNGLVRALKNLRINKLVFGKLDADSCMILADYLATNLQLDHLNYNPMKDQTVGRLGFSFMEHYNIL